MKTLVTDYLEFCDSFVKNYNEDLIASEIGILCDFLENKKNIVTFFESYIEPHTPKIVLCGINPGRHGAGKTGVSFLDFCSLSQYIPNITRNDKEKSGQFMNSVIQTIGQDVFFKHIYITNISCVGFQNSRNKKNVNYYEINPKIQQQLFDNFIREMNVIKPNIIVPLSKWVSYDLQNLGMQGRLDFPIGKRLDHPAYIKADKDVYVTYLIDLINT